MNGTQNVDTLDGWMACDFTPSSTVFQPYQDDGIVVMKGCAQRNFVTTEKTFRLQRVSNPSPTGQLSKRKYDTRHIVFTKRSTGYETFVLTADQSDYSNPESLDQQANYLVSYRGSDTLRLTTGYYLLYHVNCYVSAVVV